MKVCKEDPRYMVSENGDIYSKRLKRNLRPRIRKNGYYAVNLGREKEYYLHRIIANNFIPNPESKRTVNHKNADKSDNRVENLEWHTYSENLTHALRNKLRIPNNGRKGKFGKDCPTHKVIIQYDLSGNLLGRYYGAPDAAKATGINHSTIKNALYRNLICQRKYRFSYV